jgi:aminomethyltransferase
MTQPLLSPLHQRHVALGAKFSEFGGWLMPLQYAGVVAEHKAVRASVGVFDVSHLGKMRIVGPGALGFVNRCLTNDLSRIAPGQAQYTMLCNAAGGVIDDMIVYLFSDEEVFVIPNAANTAEVVATLAAAAPEGISVTDEHAEFAVIAVQGRNSDHVLAGMGLPVGQNYMSFTQATFAEHELTVCRTGYTGERGYEIVAPSAIAGTIWDAVLAAGEVYDIACCGLGARDTLRTEMGYPLHGHDLSPKISPVMANINWAVGWDKASFFGADALRAQRTAKNSPVLRGLKAVGRAIPRPQMVVFSGDVAVGEVTSGTFSPTLGAGIALALVGRSLSLGDVVEVAIRNRREPFEVVKLPFVATGVREV